jgi:hypothetical protein
MKQAYLYGIAMGGGLIAYFGFMNIFGLENNFYLRIFNFIILIAGVYPLLKKHIVKAEKKITYFEGFGMAFRATMTAVSLFIIFLAIYVKGINPGFVEVLEASKIWGTDISLAQAATGIFIEGMASAIVISFAWMQYFKPYTVSPNDAIRS